MPLPPECWAELDAEFERIRNSDPNTAFDPTKFTEPRPAPTVNRYAAMAADPARQAEYEYFCELADEREAAEQRDRERAGESETSPLAEPKKEQRSLASYAGYATAAAILIAVGIYAFTRGDRANTEVAQGRVDATKFMGGGGPDSQSLTVTSPMSGFLTVIELAADRKQRIDDKLASPDTPVAAGQSVTWAKSLDADTTRVVFVVTETPADSAVVRGFGLPNSKRYVTTDAEALKRDLEKYLREKGYRRLAIGVVDVTVPPRP